MMSISIDDLSDPPEEIEIGCCKCCGGEVYASCGYCQDGDGNYYHLDHDCLNELWYAKDETEKAEALGLTLIEAS